MRVQVSPAERNSYTLAHNDPDLEAVRDVLAYYNLKAYYSKNCAADLTILIKRARKRSDDNGSR